MCIRNVDVRCQQNGLVLIFESEFIILPISIYFLKGQTISSLCLDDLNAKNLAERIYENLNFRTNSIII
jgi:hypothetical protein